MHFIYSVLTEIPYSWNVDMLKWLVNRVETSNLENCKLCKYVFF